MPLVKLTEICQNNTITSNRDYSLREVFINPDQVTMLRENNFMKNLLSEGKLPSEIDGRMEFTSVHLNTGVNLNIIGSPSVIESKLRNNRQLLRG